MRRMSWTRAALMLWLMAAAPCGIPARQHEPHESTLGRVHFEVSCTEGAQRAFDRAVALLHHMTYPQARAAFEQVAEIDPKCAMAHFGVAMTLFQPLWPTRPGPSELQQGWEAVQKASSLEPPTERERLFVAAAEAFFRDPEGRDYWDRIRSWEEASEAVHRRFPDDHEAAAFYALAHLATAPAGGGGHDHHDRAAGILLAIQAENPDHPGSIHYLIHANDVPGRERESLDVVRGYTAIAPRNPHALHMPTHIYTRLGQWEEVIEGNLGAAEAALEHPAGDSGQYVWDEFPHALEYLVYAHLQRGDDRAAAAAIERLRSTKSLHPTFKTAFHLASIPARYALERQAWEEAAMLPVRPGDGLDWDRFPWPEAVTWFARALGSANLGAAHLGSANLGRLDDARGAHQRLLELEGAAERMGEELFSRQIRVLRLAAGAWIAQAEGASEKAIEQMEAAAELEATTPKHPVTPAPTLPASEMLGFLLLRQQDPGRALAAFERALEQHPGRFNALLGAARAAQALGREQEARRTYEELIEVAVEGSARSGLKEAREILRR